MSLSACNPAAPLSRQQAIAYLETGGCGCPRCGTADVQWSAMTFEEGAYFQEGACPQCHLTWHNVAPLTEIVLPNEHGDSVTFSLPALTEDESAALIRAIDVLATMGCQASTRILQQLLQNY